MQNCSVVGCGLSAGGHPHACNHTIVSLCQPHRHAQQSHERADSNITKLTATLGCQSYRGTNRGSRSAKTRWAAFSRVVNGQDLALIHQAPAEAANVARKQCCLSVACRGLHRRGGLHTALENYYAAQPLYAIRLATLANAIS